MAPEDAKPDGPWPDPGGGRPAARVRYVLIVCIGAVAIFTGLLDLLPPLERDELIHHLAIPQIWIQAGRFVETPWAAFSYYPMNLDLLYLPALALGADWGARLVHNLFGLLTAALVFAYLRRRLDTTWGLTGALIFLSTPLVMRLAASAYVDLGLTFFMTAGLAGLFFWRETGQRRWFLVSALAYGLALGTKYQALLAAPAFGLVLIGPTARSRTDLPRALLGTAAWFGLAGLVFSPWLIKNAILTGNPLYPLFNTLFGLPGLVSPELNVDLFTRRQFYHGESFWQVLATPIRIFFEGRDFSPRYFDGVLNPMLLLLPLPALVRPKFPEIRPLALIVVYWIPLVFLKSSIIVRYVAPVLPILAVLSVFGLEAIRRFLEPRLPRPAAAGLPVLILAGFLALNAAWAADFWRLRDPVPRLTGRESRRTYLLRHLDQYPAMDFINRRLPLDARVLFLFAGNRGYYCRRAYFYQTWFSGESLRPILEAARTVDDVGQGLKKLGATHILAREALLLDYLGHAVPKEKLGLWLEFRRRRLEPLFQARGYTVFRIG
ncbi:MAG: glycosyltransferase family 39 protein [Proteobacteria bacterium]|nr:glycosyltransferase family 39 protein [Pseudomonadota bacterium]